MEFSGKGIHALLLKVVSLFSYVLITLAFAALAASFISIYHIDGLVARVLATYFVVLAAYNYVLLLASDPGEMRAYSGMEIKGRCGECNFLRCERTFHCDICKACFYKRDHHCMWIGRCVAYRNFAYFFFFLVFFAASRGLFLTFGDSAFCPLLHDAHILTLALSTAYIVWCLFLLITDQTTTEYTSLEKSCLGHTRKKDFSLKSVYRTLFCAEGNISSVRGILNVFVPLAKTYLVRLEPNST